LSLSIGRSMTITITTTTTTTTRHHDLGIGGAKHSFAGAAGDAGRPGYSSAMDTSLPAAVSLAVLSLM